MDNLDRYKADYHEFTNNSEWLKKFNLSAYTTGVLYRWWNTCWMDQGDPNANDVATTGHLGQSVTVRDLYAYEFGVDDFGSTNQRGDRHTSFSYEEDPSMAVFMNGNRARRGLLQSGIQFEAWRFEDNNKGRFELIEKLVDWTWQDPREEVLWGPFDWDDLQIDEFTQKIVVSPTKDGEEPTLVDAEYEGCDYDVGILGSPYQRLSEIITMNNWVRLKEISMPKVEDWSEKDKARREFIDDIKTSRSGCLSIMCSITVDVTPDRPELCPITEYFTTNLYLRDTIKPENKAFFALPELKKIGIPKDSTGRPYGSKKDGDLSEPDETKEGDKVVADIEMHFNEYTGTYQSGSKTILAKITKTVGPADGAEDLESLKGGDNAETLDGLNDNYLQMGTGEAMPITMQNGNPYQWTPNYALPADCREGNTDKATVIVYNPDPEKSFSVGKTVLLHEVDGVWMPVEFGSGEDTTFTPEPIFKGRWEIQQFATCMGNFFAVSREVEHPWNSDCNTVDYPFGRNSQLTPIQAEQNFHRRYHYLDDLNNGSDDDPIKYAGKTTSAASNAAKEVSTKRVYSWCRQVTGFDYLEHTLGGTRSPTKRSIDRTTFGRFANGDMPSEAGGFSPENTVYFGALFPDGWTATNMDNEEESGPQTLTYEARPYHMKTWGVENEFFYDQGDTDNPVIPAAKNVLPQTLQADSDATAYQDAWKKIVDQDEQGDVKDDKKVGMFYNYADHQSTVLEQMPADYALQCSPSGTYGRPILSLRRLMELDDISSAFLKWEVRMGFYTKTYDKTIAGTRTLDDIKTLQTTARGKSFYSWLYREPQDGFPEDESGETTVEYHKSAMDWRPLRASRIQFRPLMYELYANDHGRQIPTDYYRTPYYNRDYIYNYLSFKMDDGLPAWSTQSRLREDKLRRGVLNRIYMENNDGPGGRPKGFGDWGFSPNDGCDTVNRIFYRANGLPFNNDFQEAVYNKYHPSERVHYDLYRCNYAGGTRARCNHRRLKSHGGVGGVGVIGAVCTVGAVQRVSFTTMNKLGMQSWFLNKHWYPSWGGNNFDRFDKFGTTDLSVRVYQAHERENLIYDSRFFAVHHFNDGTSLPDDFKANPALPNVLAVAKDIYEDTIIDTIEADTDNDAQKDCLVGVKRSKVDVQLASYVEYEDDCKIKEEWVIAKDKDPPELYHPTRYASPAEPTTLQTGEGDQVYKNQIYRRGDDKWGRLIPKEHWIIDPRRRGKCLPYNHYREVCQLPHFFFGQVILKGPFVKIGKVWARSTEMDNYASLTGQWASVPALETKDANGDLVRNDQDIRDVDLVLTQLGQDYKIGDRFKVEGFDNSEVTVMSTGTQGCVNGLFIKMRTVNGEIPHTEYVKYGTDVDPSVLIDADLEFKDVVDCKDFSVEKVGKITRITNGAAKLKPYNKFSVSGKGFSAFVTGATVRNLLMTDHKPKIASINDYAQLSLPSNKDDGGTAGQDFLFGFIQSSNDFIEMDGGERIVDVDVETNPSPSGLYDCFFHFHNDITHTILNNDTIGAIGNVGDQYIQLDINPV